MQFLKQTTEYDTIHKKFTCNQKPINSQNGFSMEQKRKLTGKKLSTIRLKKSTMVK